MTTTSHFQTKSDSYSSQQECLKASRQEDQTNPRYKYFTQTHFTAGDEEQFEQYRDATNGNLCIPEISLSDNIFNGKLSDIWKKYHNVDATAVINTFRYIFNKFKKGIFVKIQNGKLRVFLPFSKANYYNEWSHQIYIKHGTVNDFIKELTEQAGYRFNPNSVNPNINEWYANNCLIRYDLTRSPKGGWTPTEGESNVGNVKNMLEVLCANRQIPDIEFFINRRDFPLITRNSTEPYNNLWDGHIPLVSHLYDKYCPILSMSTSNIYADIAMPTWEDWARIQGSFGVWFPKSCRNYNETFNYNWKSKVPTAVFRGGTTGCGVTVSTNPRLKLAELSSHKEKGDGILYLDAGITNWNLRPRKLQGQKYLQTIDIKSMPFSLVPKLTPVEQSNYKYIINVDGHVSAFRLSIELNMGSVVLLVDSPWKLWYSDLLVAYVHYVPIKADLSNLIEQIKWCRTHDDKCQEIVEHARAFFNTYLQRDGVLDYMQNTLVECKKAMGTYIYNIETPLDLQISQELKELILSYPNTKKDHTDIESIPPIPRCKGLLHGIQWVINMLIKSNTISTIIKDPKIIAKNKLSTITRYIMAGFPLTIKSTSDIIKRKENIHDVYIGTHAINNLHTYIPNFTYMFGLYINGDNYNVISEYINGITLGEYIKHPKFNFQQYLFIIIQLCYALHMAQQHCGFVHYDLTPWNIIIQDTGQIQTIDYLLASDNIARVHTNLIPVIIDYGKSHAIVNDKHHGYINMFHSSTVQDILSLLVTTIDQINNDQRQLSKIDFHNLLQLANFLSGTTYRKDTFTSAKSLRDFLSKARKYSTLIAKNKGDIESKTPLDLVNHIMALQGNNKLKKSIEYTKYDYHSIMNKGNGKQVFDYILSRTVQDKIQSYLDIFKTLKMCTIPQPNNLFFMYYAAQTLEANIINVYNNMLTFMTRYNINPEPYQKFYINAMEFIDIVYKNKITSTEEKNIEYILDHEFKNLESSSYTEETFLLPQKIIELLKQHTNTYTDLTDYKDIIQLIIVNKGTYQLTDEIRSYYISNFKRLLQLNTFYMKTTIANTTTLYSMTDIIYKKDAEFLAKYNCPEINKYKNIYKHIFSLLEKL
jgi:hypothetical protein